MIALEDKLPLPAIFADKAYNKALHYKLSTSQVCAMLENNVMAKMQDTLTLALISNMVNYWSYYIKTFDKYHAYSNF